MFKYESHTDAQIQAAIQKGLTDALIMISPRAIMHTVAAGCIMQWTCDTETMTYQLVNTYRTLIITSDNSDLVIVYEERPRKLGGPKAVGIKFIGPDEPPKFNQVVFGQTQVDDDVQIEDIQDGPPPPDEEFEI